MNTIQMAYTDRIYGEIQKDLHPKVDEFLASGRYILGDYVGGFEKRIGEKFAFAHTAGMASGTDALMIALRACGVGPGDEVIIPSFTIFIDAAVVRMLGAVPQFVDVDLRDYNLDPATLEKAIGPKTKAIVVVHLFGQCADMDPILAVAQKHRIPVIEDACQAIGATYNGVYAGNLADIACFSFYPTKNLGGMGDGGLVTAKSDAMFQTIKLLHHHGIKTQPYVQDVWAYNSRLDAFQALVLDIKLKYLAGWEERRRKIAGHYQKTITNDTFTLPVELPGRHHVYHQFTLRVKNRDAFIPYLTKNNIGHAIFYPRVLYDQPAYADMRVHQRNVPCPISERMSREVISIPVNPQLTDAEVEYVAQTLQRYS